MGPETIKKDDAHGSKHDANHKDKDKAEHLAKIPLYENERPHKLDGTIAAATLLRRIHEKSIVDASLTGDARTRQTIFAADDATELVNELIQINSLQKANWSEVATELSYALGGIAHLEGESRGPEKARLSKARIDLQHVVDPKIFAGADKGAKQDGKLPAMNQPQLLEMAAQAVIAACRQTALFKNLKPTDIGSARKLMSQIRLHYDTASDAMAGITDHWLPLRINSDVTLATKGMTDVEEFLTDTAHPMPWDATFAAGFDAEARFLSFMGRSGGEANTNRFLPSPRRYSGTIDPNTAIKDIKDIGEGKGPGHNWSEDKFQSPQQTVLGIGVAMDEILRQQTQAVKDATSAIAQPRLPKDQSMLDTLLEILIKTALAGAAGAIGSKISSSVKSKVEKALGAKAAQSSFMFQEGKGADYFDARESAQAAAGKAAISSGAAATTMKAESAKDAFKEFFKSSGYKAIMAVIGAAKGQHSNNTNPLEVFRERSETVLGRAQFEEREEFVHLAPALAQADPQALQDLYTTLVGDLSNAYTIQYSFAMEEWQNFKAKMYNGTSDDVAPKDHHAFHEKDTQSATDREAKKPAPDDSKLDTSDAKLNAQGHDEEKGALLIEAWINTDDFLGATKEPQVQSLRLPDAEDGTLSHFRTGKQHLGDVHMNKLFRLKFVAYMSDYTVNVGVGADHGLQESTLDKKELASLRVLAAGEKLSSANWNAAMYEEDAKYSRFTQHQLQKELEKYIKVIQLSQKMNTLQR